MNIFFKLIFVFSLMFYSTLNVQAMDRISHKILSINIGPGSGEYAYMVEPVRDIGGLYYNVYEGNSETHAQNTIDLLQQKYPNLKNVNLIVGWFGDTLDGETIRIRPLTNHKELFKGAWNVGDYTRRNAELTSFDENGIANWGGTPSDESILTFAKALKNLGYNVTLYPMLFIDAPGKPWRGHIEFKSINAIEHFSDEYNKFPLHYVNLEYNGEKLLDYIDDMIIATELVSFTDFENNDKVHNGVFKLIELAGIIKEQSTNKLKLTYSANWTEYHHADDLSYPLDDLWASKHIDYVGIDAYFPLTEVDSQKEITADQILAGWESGVNYDYYIDDHDEAQHLKPEYAIQNIEWWWKNKHVNPDGTTTAWEPKMKPIIFTEVGFPSVDCATNLPASYYDPKSVDSCLPEGSKGLPDYNAQLLAVRATEDYWSRKNAIEGNEDLVARRDYYYIDVRHGFEMHDSDGYKYPYGHNLKISEMEDLYSTYFGM